MRLSFLAALAAATALIPAAASAQNHDRGGWHRGGGDNNGGRENRGGRDAARPARPAMPARPQFRAPDRVDGAPRFDRERFGGLPDRPQQPARPAGGDWHAQAGGSHAGDRPDRNNWNRDRGQWGRGNDQGQWANGRDGRDGRWAHDRNDRGGQWSRGDNDRNGQWNRDRNDRDNRWSRDRNDRDGRWDRDDRRDGRWDRDRSDWRGRGGFDRDWRRDHRYDWRDYRTRNRRVFHLPRYYAPYGWGYGYRRFGIGFTLDSVLFGSTYWIGDPWMYRLPPAYGPYRWVRYYNDALLVDIRSGYVVDVVYDIFW
jgi:hypothetical protein